MPTAAARSATMAAACRSTSTRRKRSPGVELILTRLHAGGKFSGKNYTFSGGLHGVGVSVVNALSKQVHVFIKRDGNEYRMTFAHGDRTSPLEVVGSVGKKNTGTRLRFWPDAKYFDTPKFNLRALKHLLRAKAVLCPGLTVRLHRRRQRRARGMALRGRPARLPQGRTGRHRTAAAGSVRRTPEQGHRSRRLGGRLGSRWRAGAGKLRQPDPDRAARHPRQRPAHRLHRCAARVLRLPQPAAARHQAGAGRRVGSRRLRAVGEDDRPAVQRPDQGTPVVAPGRRLRRRRRARCVLAVAQPAHRTRREDRAAGDRTRLGPAENGKADHPQESHPGPCPARQARRLHLAGPVAHGTVPGRRRFRRRQRAAGARQGFPGDPAACAARS